MQGPAGSNRVELLSLDKRTIISPCALGPGCYQQRMSERTALEPRLMHAEAAWVYLSFQKNKWLGN